MSDQDRQEVIKGLCGCLAALLQGAVVDRNSIGGAALRRRAGTLMAVLSAVAEASPILVEGVEGRD